MERPSPLAAAPPSAQSVAADPAANLAHLPAAAQAAYAAFRSRGDTAQLDPLLFAILESYLPRPPEKPLADYPGETLLIDDLGFDSLSITEVVFFAEDLFDISISNAELVQIRTLDELRRFIRQKIAARTAARGPPIAGVTPKAGVMHP